MSLKNKRILITAGPTWVPIDSVRVISNIATGKTGVLLAEKFQQLNTEVTLLLGPAQVYGVSSKVRIIHFKFYDELSRILEREIGKRKFDIIVHSAAVSDYRPKSAIRHKISSDKKEWNLKLIPTEKIINRIKKVNPSAILAGFKFEPDAGKEVLLKKAAGLLKSAKLDLAVGNTVNGKKYLAYILDKKKRVYGPFRNKSTMASRLIRLIGENLLIS